jgi:hypothetical protein
MNTSAVETCMQHLIYSLTINQMLHKCHNSLFGKLIQMVTPLQVTIQFCLPEETVVNRGEAEETVVNRGEAEVYNGLFG